MRIKKTDYRQLKNDFNHIYKNIKMFYGTKYCSDYINDLFIMSRIVRQGFPPNIFKLLLEIKQINDDKLEFSK